MTTKKRVRDEAVHIPLCIANGDGICAELIPGGYCVYSEVCSNSVRKSLSPLYFSTRGSRNKEN